MRTVIKCDFCSETKDIYDAAEMLSHEQGCHFNPETRGCYTCGHYKDMGRVSTGEFPTCNIGEDAGFVLWESISCELHESKIDRREEND